MFPLTWMFLNISNTELVTTYAVLYILVEAKNPLVEADTLVLNWIISHNYTVMSDFVGLKAD